MFSFEVGSLLNIAVVLGAGLAVSVMMIWVERRFLGFWSDRLGPNRVGPFGIFQVIADAIKMLFKEDWIPPFSDKFTFVLAPMILPIVMLMALAVIPFAPGVGVMDLNIGLLWIFAMAGLASYSTMLGGLASNNKFSLLGSLRGTGQMISYEVFMGISILGVVILADSFTLRDIVESQRDGWYVVPQFFGFIVFTVAGLAESHRWPFDLPESEAEIISGYNTEYSGMKFGLFMIGEYIAMVVMALLMPVLFFGGWHAPFGLEFGTPLISGLFWMSVKAGFFLLFFILVRAALVRPRYDQLMSYGWLVMLPLSLINLLVTGAIVLYQAG
ncbi:MAG: NADH-quinone oxidoreductase subunit NuoH [Gammaproteobacteria bacterium]|nr:NADH-quinone oxidoreductase subunit NuoH [Gammaproteobacteria bacterium]MAY01665.1 NADH-quinone oxidoreductase subunit NuoH [Gammaproteobacteria bacterium]|tara:strand:+ start:162647 stop:163630 length:984 start_codon:yes stop_codon:yes gene_type:complete